jgi:hypothetical protein
VAGPGTVISASETTRCGSPLILMTKSSSARRRIGSRVRRSDTVTSKRVTVMPVRNCGRWSWAVAVRAVERGVQFHHTGGISKLPLGFAAPARPFEFREHRVLRTDERHARREREVHQWLRLPPASPAVATKRRLAVPGLPEDAADLRPAEDREGQVQDHQVRRRIGRRVDGRVAVYGSGVTPS